MKKISRNAVLAALLTLVACRQEIDNSSTKLIGGQDATSSSLIRTHALALLNQSGQVHCSAVYLGDGLALTSAHCLFSNDNLKTTINGNDIDVSNDLNIGYDLKPTLQNAFSFDYGILHSSFDMDEFRAKMTDINSIGDDDESIKDVYTDLSSNMALVSFKTAKLPGFLNKVEIAANSDVDEAFIAGYGKTKTRAGGTLNYAKVKRVRGEAGDLGEIMRFTGIGGQDVGACDQDAGGPVFAFQNNRYTLIGIILATDGNCSTDIYVSKISQADVNMNWLKEAKNTAAETASSSMSLQAFNFQQGNISLPSLSTIPAGRQLAHPQKIKNQAPRPRIDPPPAKKAGPRLPPLLPSLAKAWNSTRDFAQKNIINPVANTAGRAIVRTGEAVVNTAGNGVRKMRDAGAGVVDAVGKSWRRSGSVAPRSGNSSGGGSGTPFDDNGSGGNSAGNGSGTTLPSSACEGTAIRYTSTGTNLRKEGSVSAENLGWIESCEKITVFCEAGDVMTVTKDGYRYAKAKFSSSNMKLSVGKTAPSAVFVNSSSLSILPSSSCSTQ